jgi:hypothetical protein
VAFHYDVSTLPKMAHQMLGCDLCDQRACVARMVLGHPRIAVSPSARASTMRIHNIYADENGETHFRDIEIEITEHGADGSTSGRLPATGFYFRTAPANWLFDWHPATR